MVQRGEYVSGDDGEGCGQREKPCSGSHGLLVACFLLSACISKYGGEEEKVVAMEAMSEDE